MTPDPQPTPPRCLARLVLLLPCFPCPHNSVCCKWGTYLSPEEAKALLSDYGPEFIYWSEDDKEWRTQVKDGRCSFWSGGCQIHAHKFYPRVCHIYPWEDGRTPTLPSAHDADMCPSFSQQNVPRQVSLAGTARGSQASGAKALGLLCSSQALCLSGGTSSLCSSKLLTASD